MRLLVITPDRVAGFVKADQALEAMDKLDYGQGNFCTATAASTRDIVHVYTDPNMLSRFSNFGAAMSCTLLIGYLVVCNEMVAAIARVWPDGMVMALCGLWAAAKFTGGGLSAASEHSIFPSDIVALCDANFVEALGSVLRSCDAPI